MRTNTKQFNALVYPYILDCIEGEGYGKTFANDTEKLQFLADCFKQEYVFPDNLRRHGSYQNLFREWIMGLPSSFGIEWENYAIIQLAKKWGSIDENTHPRLVDRVLENWFNLIAAKTFQLFEKHNISFTH